LLGAKQTSQLQTPTSENGPEPDIRWCLKLQMVPGQETRYV
jgi:hypothetical protein